MKKYILLFLITGILHSSDVYIIFTANVNGILEDCRCGNEPLGGLARVKTFVSQFKQKHPNTLFIDGGDFFNPYKFPDLNLNMSEIVQYMSYDIITAGDQEFIEGYDLFKKHLQRYQSIFLASNCNFGNKIFELKIKEIPVTVVSYLSPNCFSFINKPEQIEIDSVFAAPAITPTNGLRVLLFHGEARQADEMIKHISNVDLVLLGHAQRLDSWEVDGRCFVGGGLDTELIMVVEAIRRGAKWEFKVISHKMDQSVTEDPQIKKLVEQSKIGHKEH
jgi:2',3'-cyclic-nucleotide 2'-phosphodiesterase (5'-nucleotidase family)